ncbi:MAG TPA: amino acid adenylation domain-containing protein, partial [Blastocatellia bacterium]|nr:amino acid adenylation domain-containing protein [Blastocatellia bacterium]
QRVVDRHPIFRTAFMWEGLDEPVQVVCNGAQLPLEQQDWRELSEARQRQQMEEYLESNRILGFELSEPPLMRLALFRVGDRVHQFVWSCHHLLIDGWSTPLLLKEVFAYYNAFCAGQDLTLELPRPYKDYIAWLQQQDMVEAEKFWRATLAGFSTPTRLLVARPERDTIDQSQAVGEVRRQLSGETVQRLQSFASQHQLTLNTLVQGAWALLLSHYSGERDVVFGVTVSGRPADLKGAQAMMGIFINTLPARMELPGEERLLPWLKSIQARQVDARQYEYSPLVDVQAWSDVPGGVALFESLLVFENFPVDKSLQTLVRQNSDLEIRDVRVKKQTNYPLALVVAPSQMSVLMIYERERFYDEVVARMLSHFETLLERMVLNPHQQLSSVCLLSESELERVTVQWNDTRAEYSAELYTHELFEAQVRRSPDAVAAVFRDSSLTYLELNRRANQVGNYLQSTGVGPEVKVGIYVRRSLDLLVGILGVLKSGAAYVPLDPEHPLDRLGFILDDIQSPVLLTQETLSDRLPATWAQVVCLDSDWELIAGGSDDNPASDVAGENLAYVIYTSGSTGAPKGVMVEHRSLVNYLRWCNDAYSVEKGQGTPVHSRIGFDLTITSLFSPLLSGRRAVFVAEEEGIEGLSRALRKGSNYSLVKLTPAHVEVLNNLLPPEEAKGRTNALIIGGEPLTWQSLSFWLEHSPATRLINEYGPTETVVGCCVYEATGRRAASGPVPIGRPISNTQIYILDSWLRPVPPGVAGEMYVGGIGVTRGYLNQPDQTAELFIPDPFGLGPGGRLYKTGDLARHLPDGNLEFLGRRDDQIKMRGYRIELGEIESTLSRHPAISECAVVVSRDEAGQGRLLAFLVPDKDRAFAVDQRVRLEKEGALQAKSLYELPNGMTIAHLNRNETDLLYKEIFEEKSYLMHGISLDAGACIFDVGANIGMFTLFAGQICKDSTIYAFEPIPDVFDRLRINTSLYGLNVKLFQCGVGSAAANDTFTYYPHASVLSGRFADLEEERESVGTVLLNERSVADGVITLDEKMVEELLKERLTTESITCRLTTISDVIREYGVDRIDLLKIDVEKSEMDVLTGIANEDWQKIRQMVVEVHDVDDRLGRITTLLASKGFDFTVDQDPAYKGTALYNIYAARQPGHHLPGNNGKAASTSNGRWHSADRLINDVQEFLKRQLPGYMVPSAFALLDSLPLTPNGKVDRQALPVTDLNGSNLKGEYLAPRTPLEEIIADIWSKVLGHERIGMTDDFFALGGHSLLATQVISRLREAFQWEVPLQTLFDAPTVAELAKSIEEGLDSRQAASVPPIRPAPGHLPLPLSFAQQRLWFLDQLEPGNSGYNISDP